MSTPSSRSPASGRPPASGTRQTLERWSAPALVALRRQPRLVVPLVILLLAAIGVLGPAPGGAASLLVVAAFLGWLGYLSWPVVGGAARLLRALGPLLLVAVAVLRLTS